MAQREVGSAKRAQSCERKSALPVAVGSRHQRSSSVGPQTQSVFSTPLTRQGSTIIKSSSRATSSKKFKNVQFPTGDREFQKTALNTVRSYLQDNSDLNINWSTFGSQTLSVATYLEIFNFLLNKLFNSAKLNPKNYVDELPRWMKLLSYPVNIQKSSLHTINTRNSWPSVLGMLIFLVDQVTLCDKAASEMMMLDNGVNPELQKEVFWHKKRLYLIWNDNCEGDDVRKIKEANEEFKEKLTHLFIDDEKIAALEEEVKQLEKELKMNDCTELDKKVQTLKATKDRIYNDQKMIELEINKLKNLRNEREGLIEDRKHKLQVLEEHNNKKRAEIQRLKEQCKMQKVTAEDTERILQEIQEVKERIKQRKELCSSLGAALFQTDKEIAKLKMEVDTPYVELKKFQCAYSNVPDVSAIEIGSRYSPEDWEYANSQLHNLKKRLSSKKLQLEKCSAELQTKVSKLKEQLDQLLEEETSAKRHLKNLDEHMQKLKSDSKEIDTSLLKKEEELQISEQTLQVQISMLKKIVTEIEDCKKEYENLVAEGEQRIKEGTDQLKWMKDTLSETKKEFKERTGYPGDL